MSDVAILNEMIKDTVKVPLTSAGNWKMVTLTEPRQLNSLVKICGLPNDVIVIKAEDFRSPDTVFGGLRGECKRADFVIVADAVNKKTILCIEMKATKGTRNEIVLQLKGAKCFITYCQEIGKNFWNKGNFLDDYRYRFVSIGHTSIPKKKTRFILTHNVHDRPDRMLKIDYAKRLEFNRLAGA